MTKWLATAGLLFVFVHLTTAQQLAIQTGHAGNINKIRFSPNAKLLASASDDRSAIIWDLKTNLQSLLLKGHDKKLNDLSFSRDNKLLATASDDGRVIIWDVATGQNTSSFEIGHPVKAIVFDSNPTVLYCASDYIYKLDITNGKKTPIGPKSAVHFNAIALNEKNDLLAFGGLFDPVSVYALTSASVKSEINVKVNELNFSGNYLLLAGKTGRLVAYDANQSKKKFNKNSLSLFHGYNAVEAVTNKYIFGGDETGLLTVYKFKNGKKKIDVRPINGELKTLTVSPDEKIIACAGTDKRIVLLNSEDFTVLTVLRGSAERITNISFSEDGNSLFMGHENGNIKLWDLSPGGKILFNSFQVPEKKQRKQWSNPVSYSPYLIKGNQVLIKQNLVKRFRADPDTIKRIKNQLLSWDLIKNEITPIKNTRHEIILSNKNAFISENLSYLHPAAKRQRAIYSYIVPYFALRALTITSDPSGFFNIVNVADAGIFGYNQYPHASKIYPLNTEKKTRTLLKKDKQTVKRDVSGSGKVLIKEVRLRSLNSDGTRLLTVFENRQAKKKNRIVVTELGIGKTLNRVDFEQEVTNALLSPSGNYFMVELGNVVALFRTEGNLVWQDEGSFPATFDPAESRVLYTNTNADIISRNMLGAKQFQYASHHADKISGIRFNPTHPYFATASLDGTVKFWDDKKTEEKITLISIGREEFIYVTPQNYYYASKGALGGLGFRLQDKIFTFDQFDAKFNRPDIVIGNLPYADSELVRLYQEAYKKRIAILGMDASQITTTTNLPEFKITGLDQSLQVENPEFNFGIEAFDKGAKLKELHVLVDGVPVFGSKGKTISSVQPGQLWKENIGLKLVPGTNKVQMYLVNENGVHSYKESFQVNLKARERKPDLYLVAVGSSKFSDKSFDLNYASKDARDVEKLFRSESGFNKVYTKVLLDQEVTKTSISQLNQFYSSATENDVVVFFFAGHGILDASLNYFLSTYDIDFGNPSVNGIPYSMIDNLMEGTNSRKKLLFVDACHSGEVDKAESEIQVASNLQTDEQIKFRTVGTTTLQSTNKLGLKNLLEVTKNLFADLRKSNGATVISSAGGAEYAMEGAEWKNGIFTYSLLKGIKKKEADLNHDNQITVAELRKYLFAEVPKLTGGKQSPTSRSENISNNFIIH
jgi:WD40 repeat protein